MKKLIWVLIAVLLLCVAAVALADETEEIRWKDYEGEMRIVNCNEWVSFRQQPDTNAKRLAKVLLDDAVQNCRYFDNGFFYCEYKGKPGYILAQYLAPIQNELAEITADIIPTTLYYNDLLMVGGEVLRYEYKDMIVLAVRTFDLGEMLQCGAFRADDHSMVWGYTAYVSAIYELYSTDAWIGGASGMPYVQIYNAPHALAAISVEDGKELWRVDTAAEPLGSGVCRTIAEDGTLYIAGYYGPGPKAISVDGKLKWTSEPDDANIYWPYAMELKDDCLVVTYENPNQLGENVIAYNRKDGSIQGKNSVLAE